jgi:uncharacterized protein
MYFNVSQLLKEPSGASRIIEVDDVLTLSDGAHVRVVGRGKLLRTNKSIWLSATLDSEVVCTCSRCLVEHEQPVHIVIEEEFFPVVDVDTGSKLDDSDDRYGHFYVDQYHTLDLTEAASQYFALNIPMKPLCREECAGMCLSCGVNLNEGTCICDKMPRDARWGTFLQAITIPDRGC